MRGDGDGKADPWWYGTWEGNREARFEAALAATPAQRLAWLEDALQLAFRATGRLRPAGGEGMEREEEGWRGSCGDRISAGRSNDEN